MSWLSFFLCSKIRMETVPASGTEQNSRRLQKTFRTAERLERSYPHLSIINRRNWHLATRQVAGLHRAVPSTTLDKAVWLCSYYISTQQYVKLHFPLFVRNIAPRRRVASSRSVWDGQSGASRSGSGNFPHLIVTKTRKSPLFCTEFLTSMLDKYRDVRYDYF